MANSLIDNAVTIWHRFAQQASNATPPAATYWRLFFKAGGLYTIDSSANVIAHGGGAITTLTIASGGITITGKHHFVDVEGGVASSDDLDTINGGYEGQELFLQALDGGRTVVIKHATDNIRTPNGEDISLDESYKVGHLVYDGSFWNLVGSDLFLYPNNLLDWGDPPDGSLTFSGQYSDDSLWQFTGNEMRSPLVYTRTSSTNIGISAFDMVLFNSTSDLAVTMGGTLPNVGFHLIAKALQVSGGAGHTLKLPTGATFDGTNNTCTLNSTSDFLEAWAVTTTLYFCTANTVGVAFSVT